MSCHSPNAEEVTLGLLKKNRSAPCTESFYSYIVIDLFATNFEKAEGKSNFIRMYISMYCEFCQGRLRINMFEDITRNFRS